MVSVSSFILTSPPLLLTSLPSVVLTSRLNPLQLVPKKSAQLMVVEDSQTPLISPSTNPKLSRTFSPSLLVFPARNSGTPLAALIQIFPPTLVLWFLTVCSPKDIILVSVVPQRLALPWLMVWP